MPKASLTGRDVAIAAAIEPADPHQNLFYEPFNDMLASISEADKERLRAAAVEVIDRDVVPAHRALLTFFRNE